MTTIPFGGTAPAMNALVGGQVDMMCDQTTNNTTAGQICRPRRAWRSHVPAAEEQQGAQGPADPCRKWASGMTPTIWHGLQWHPKARCRLCWPRSTLP
jgi:hypothetical protein